MVHPLPQIEGRRLGRISPSRSPPRRGARSAPHPPRPPHSPRPPTAVPPCPAKTRAAGHRPPLPLPTTLSAVARQRQPLGRQPDTTGQHAGGAAGPVVQSLCASRLGVWGGGGAAAAAPAAAFPPFLPRLCLLQCASLSHPPGGHTSALGRPPLPPPPLLSTSLSTPPSGHLAGEASAGTRSPPLPPTRRRRHPPPPPLPATSPSTSAHSRAPGRRLGSTRQAAAAAVHRPWPAVRLRAPACRLQRADASYLRVVLVGGVVGGGGLGGHAAGLFRCGGWSGGLPTPSRPSRAAIWASSRQRRVGGTRGGALPRGRPVRGGGRRWRRRWGAAGRRGVLAGARPRRVRP